MAGASSHEPFSVTVQWMLAYQSVLDSVFATRRPFLEEEKSFFFVTKLGNLALWVVVRTVPRSGVVDSVPTTSLFVVAGAADPLVRAAAAAIASFEVLLAYVGPVTDVTHVSRVLLREDAGETN